MLWGLERSLKEIVVYVPTNWSTHATIFCKEIQKKMSIDDDPITIRVVQLRWISLHLVLVYFLPSYSVQKLHFSLLIRFYVNSILVSGKRSRLQILNCHKFCQITPPMWKKPTKSSISHPKVNVFIIGSAYPNFNTGVGIPVFFVDKA